MSLCRWLLFHKEQERNNSYGDYRSNVEAVDEGKQHGLALHALIDETLRLTLSGCQVAEVDGYGVSAEPV